MEPDKKMKRDMIIGIMLTMLFLTAVVYFQMIGP
jgi:hypothetical protein